MLFVFWTLIVLCISCAAWGTSGLVRSRVRKTLDESIDPDPIHISYSRIATLERDNFGETFHNPDTAPYFGPCRCDGCRYKVSPVDPNASDEYRYGLPDWSDREGP